MGLEVVLRMFEQGQVHADGDDACGPRYLEIVPAEYEVFVDP